MYIYISIRIYVRYYILSYSQKQRRQRGGCIPTQVNFTRNQKPGTRKPKHGTPISTTLTRNTEPHTAKQTRRYYKNEIEDFPADSECDSVMPQTQDQEP